MLANHMYYVSTFTHCHYRHIEIVIDLIIVIMKIVVINYLSFLLIVFMRLLVFCGEMERNRIENSNFFKGSNKFY